MGSKSNKEKQIRMHYEALLLKGSNFTLHQDGDSINGIMKNPRPRSGYKFKPKDEGELERRMYIKGNHEVRFEYGSKTVRISSGKSIRVATDVYIEENGGRK
jgi:hypothetical protein